jgi:hypothetical protein
MPIEKPLYLSPEQEELMRGAAMGSEEMIEEFGDTGIDSTGMITIDPETGEAMEGGDGGEYADEDAGEEERFDANLAEYISDEDLADMVSVLEEQTTADEESRQDWIDIYHDGIRLLGLKIEELQEPFPGACSATHPLLIEAVVKFQSKAVGELCPARGPVRTQIIGVSTPEKEAQSRRVREYMNYQVTHEMTEWREETEMMLFYLGFAGSAFKKTYYDALEERPVTRYIKSEDFLINYNASDLATARRYSQRYLADRNEILKRMAHGEWLQMDLAEASDVEHNDAEDEVMRIEGRSQSARVDDEHEIFETHTYLDLPGYEHEDGYELPYVVTWEKDSNKILAIRRNWKEGDPKMKKRVWFTHYKLIPGLGFYGYGFLHLIGGLARTTTTSLRQLTDAGTFSNLPAGFKQRGLRITGDGSPLMPGEFREVNAVGGELSKSLMPLPFKEPSATLYNLLQFTAESAQKFADGTEAVIADSTNYGPVGTTMALLEASGKLFSAIHMRLHFAQMQDLKLLAEINSETLPEQYPYEVAGAAQNIMRADFDGRIDVIPVSDPNLPSRSHRLAKANALSQEATADPQNFNLREVRLETVRALDYDDPERFMAPPPSPPFVGDAVSENATVLIGKPIAAAEYQDHDAHMIVHTALMADPTFQQNEQVAPAMAQHIKEHMRFKYLAQMKEAGVELPQDGQQMQPEMQQKIDQAAAQAAEAILDANIEGLEQKRVKEMMQNIEFVLKNRELDIEEATMNQNAQLKREELNLKREDMLIDDENTDLDRLSDMAMVQEQTRTQKETAGMKKAAS